MNLKIGGYISYVLALISVGMGFFKMYVYEEGDLFTDPINAYVGGDAYNFIINGTYATAFFMLATMFVILGSVLVYFHYTLPKNKESNVENITV